MTLSSRSAGTGKGWKRHKSKLPCPSRTFLQPSRSCSFPPFSKAFFFLWLLESTSTYLASLLAPQIAAYDLALESDPLAELDDFLAFSALPASIRRELDERAEWVKKCWRDGEKLGEWEAEMKRRRRVELKDARIERKLAAERVIAEGSAGVT